MLSVSGQDYVLQKSGLAKRDFETHFSDECSKTFTLIYLKGAILGGVGLFRLFKRYRLIFMFIFVSFFCAFLSLCSGIISVMSIQNEMKIQSEYAYKYEIEVKIYNNHDISGGNLHNICSEFDNFNVYLEEKEIVFEEIDNVYIPDIILVQNEPLSLPDKYKKGSLPQKSIIAPSNCAKGLKKLTLKGFEFSIYRILDVEKYPFLSGTYSISRDVRKRIGFKN